MSSHAQRGGNNSSISSVSLDTDRDRAEIASVSQKSLIKEMPLMCSYLTFHEYTLHEGVSCNVFFSTKGSSRRLERMNAPNRVRSSRESFESLLRYVRCRDVHHRFLISQRLVCPSFRLIAKYIQFVSTNTER